MSRAVSLAFVVSLGLVGGCETTPRAAQEEAGPNYRTIRTDPTRDTQAAQRFHQQGLDALEDEAFDKAQGLFQKALQADVEYGPAHNNLGRVYFHNGDLYNAAWEFEFAAKLMPQRPEPPGNLGLVLERAGEYDRAIESYRQAITRAPDDIEYRANLARVLVRRGDRTQEVVRLLEQVLAEDRRPTWIIWAQSQLAGMRHLQP